MVTRNWPLIVACLVASLVGGALSNLVCSRSAQAQTLNPGNANVVTAQAFYLVRPDGTQAGRWALTPTGESHIILWNKSGKARAIFGVVDKDDRAYLLLTGKDGVGGVQLGVEPDGEAFLALFDKTGDMDRAKVFVTPNGQGKIILHKDRQTVSWRAP